MKTRLIYLLSDDDLDPNTSTVMDAVPELQRQFDLALLAQAGRTRTVPAWVSPRVWHALPDLAWQLWQLLRGSREAVLISHTVAQVMLAVVLARLLGVRLIQLLYVPSSTPAHQLARHRWLNRWPVLHLTSTCEVRDRLLLRGVRQDRVLVLDAVLPRWTANLDIKDGHADEVRRIALFSSFDGGDQLDLLLQALTVNPSLNTAEFHVYGSGPHFESLRRQAAARGLNMLFMGISPQSMQFLASYDAWVQTDGLRPSPTTLQALRLGLPVLAPYSQEQKFCVEEGISGCCFQAGSARELAGALSRLLHMPAWQREKLGDEGRFRVLQAFGPVALVERYRRAVSRGGRLVQQHQQWRALERRALS